MKTDLCLPDVSRAIREISLPRVDLVIGIATGGIVPAALAAHELNLDLATIRVQYRDPQNSPMYEAPQSGDLPLLPDYANRILLVDDVVVSGKTIETVRALLNGKVVYTLVLKGKADFVLFPDIRTCIRCRWRPGDF